MCKLSVIVPVYKVEKYLSRCIESILNQTFTDYELILIDDGSPDNCPQICDEWAKKDERIKVIHKENGGVALARNIGLDIMVGKYVTFIDSDDFIHDQMFSFMMSAIEKNDADIAVCSYTKTNKSITPIEISNQYITLNNIESVSMLYDSKHSIAFITPWGKIIRSKLFCDIRFPVGKFVEDEFTTYKIFYNSKKTIFTEDKFYFYYTNTESFVQSAFSEKNLDALEAFKERILYFEQKNEVSLTNQAKNVLIARIMYSHQRICREKSIKNKKELKKKALNYLHFIDKAQINLYSSHLPLEQRIWMYIFIISPDIYSYLRNIFRIGL